MTKTHVKLEQGLCYSSVHNVKNFETNNYELEYEYGCSPPEQSGGFFQVQNNLNNIFCEARDKLSFHISN